MGVSNTENKSKEAYNFKVILIGDSNVGKSSLLVRLCENKFKSTISPTTEAIIKQKVINIEGNKIKLKIWDIAGQERFWYSLAPQYFHGANGIVFVYDLMSINSFKSLYFWKKHCEKKLLLKNIPCVLVGNKSDLSNFAESEITHQMKKDFCEDYNMPFYETSAASDNEYINVLTLFSTLALKIIKYEGLPTETKKVESEKESICSIQ